MIEVQKLLKKSNEFDKFLDDAEKECLDLWLWSGHDIIQKNQFWGRRKSLVKLLQKFRPNSNALQMHEKPQTKSIRS